MKLFDVNKIKTKFILFLLGFILLGTGIPIYFLVSQFRENYRERSIILTKTSLNVLEFGLHNAMLEGKQKNLQKIIAKLSEDKNIDNIRIVDKAGKIYYSTAPEEKGKLIQNVALGHSNTNLEAIKKRQISFLENNKIYSAVEPINNASECQKCHGDKKIIAYLDIDTDLTNSERIFFTGSRHMIFLGMLLIIILVVGSYLLFDFHINTPLNKFILALNNVEKGDLNLHLNTDRPDEFGVLNSHFNSMIEQLKSSFEKIENLHFEQLRRADKLVTLGELTASIAHDVNNYAAIIFSRADYLIYEAQNNSQLNHYIGDLEVINRQINNISKITSNILRNSKRLPMEAKEVNLVTIITNVLDTLKPLLKKHAIRVETEFPRGSAIIVADQTQIEQLLMNIINNAIDAMGNNGILKLMIDKEKLDHWQIIIQDDGIGMENEMIKNIFSPFFTTKLADKGTGLGLYIAKNICLDHNAEIQCSSKPGNGTIFTITFKGMKN